MNERLDASSRCFRDALQHVYGLAHNVCVDGEEQRALLSSLHESEVNMAKDGSNGNTVIATLLGTIMDGLKYGNWPWIKNGVDTLKRKAL